MYLSIDLGSTQFKAAVYDRDFTVRGAGSCPLTYRYPGPGCVELDATQVEQAWTRAIGEALATAGNPGAIRAIAIASQAQTFTAVDPDGNPRHPFISWLDERSTPTCARMAARGPWNRFADASSFGFLLAGLQVCILRHLIDSGERVPDSHDRLWLLPALLAFRLTGRAAVDHNLAAMSGLYDLRKGDWWGAALQDLGLDPRQLPDLIATGKPLGATTASAAALGLPAGIPVVLAGNDQTAGAYGAEIESRHALLMTLGTAHVVYAVADRLPDPASGIIRGGYPGKRFYRMAADSCGGNVITWAAGLLAGGNYDRLFELAAEGADSVHGLVFNPEIVTGGAWTGISVSHGPAAFARSVVDSLVSRMADMVSRVDPEQRAGQILAAGGSARRPLILELLARATGRSIEPIAADPLRGAARLAGEAIA